MILTVSPIPLDRQVETEGATYLDRQHVVAGPGPLRDAGSGIMRCDSINWTVGRQHNGPSIS